MAYHSIAHVGVCKLDEDIEREDQLDQVWIFVAKIATTTAQITQWNGINEADVLTAQSTRWNCINDSDGLTAHIT